MPGLAIVTVFLIIWGIFLINGKGTFLIAGYNTMSKEQKSHYDDSALAKAMGKIAFVLAFTNFLTLLGDIYNLKWLRIIGIVLTLCMILYLIIYFNNSKRIKK